MEDFELQEEDLAALTYAFHVVENEPVAEKLRRAKLRREMRKAVEKEKKQIQALSYPEKVCPFCNYRWKPRVEKPRECPRCKRHFEEIESLPSVPAQMNT